MQLSARGGLGAWAPLLSLGLLLALLLLAPRPAVAGDDWAGLRADVYADEWIVVISPAAAARAEVADTVNIEGGFALDVLSGATPVLATDAMTSATYFEETRRDTHMAIKYAPAETWDVGVSGAVSIEPDHLNASGTARARLEAFERMTSIGLAYTFLHESVGTVHDERLDYLTIGHSADLNVSQILTRNTSLMFIATGQMTNCQAALGCQANPYRSVPMLSDAGLVALAVSERHPGRRLRGAAAVRLAQFLGRGFGLQAGYRVYSDSWRLMGHTGDVALVGSFFGRRLVARLEGRFTWQDSAAFFRGRYDADASDPEVPAFRTADRELARQWNAMVGARLAYEFSATGPVQLGVNARLSRHAYRYLNYPQMPERNAWLAGTGFHGAF